MRTGSRLWLLEPDAGERLGDVWTTGALEGSPRVAIAVPSVRKCVFGHLPYPRPGGLTLYGAARGRVAELATGLGAGDPSAHTLTNVEWLSRDDPARFSLGFNISVRQARIREEGVSLFCGEDDPADTMRPRIDALRRATPGPAQSQRERAIE